MGLFSLHNVNVSGYHCSMLKEECNKIISRSQSHMPLTIMVK